MKYGILRNKVRFLGGYEGSSERHMWFSASLRAVKGMQGSASRDPTDRGQGVVSRIAVSD